MEKQIITLLTKYINLDQKFNSATLFTELDGWDSLKHVQFILDLENEFQIKMNPEQLVSCTSVEKSLEILNSK